MTDDRWRDIEPCTPRRGDFVKIVRHRERFWCEVLHEHDVPGVFSGRVNNHLVFAPYEFGEEIQFTRDEVIQQMRRSEDGK